MNNTKVKTLRFTFVTLALCLGAFVFSACSELQKPKTEPFYAETAPPPKQEFRWSNGKMPKSFDPARAAAPPETDVARALYEGLTDTDPKTLQPIAAVAVDWKSSDDDKIWTFRLRRDARWSNGERLTAKDFVRSWKRLKALGAKASYPNLLSNIVGLQKDGEGTLPNVLDEKIDSSAEPLFNPAGLQLSNQIKSIPTPEPQEFEPDSVDEPADENLEMQVAPKAEIAKKQAAKFGVRAVGNFTLEVSLVKSDKDFPALVAHPMFRPVYGNGKDLEAEKLNAGIVTSGAFRVASVGQDGVTLDRAENFWNAGKIKLERVRFVPTENAEKALEAYRAGELDAVTNAEFEPLALKLLTPFDDFRLTTHSALNFYEFNSSKPPFDDRRVREALAISIERERITEGEMEGASHPALSFLPFEKANGAEISQNAARAANLLAEAGFPKGENFPVVRLLVNRNNVQQRIARSVAKMWKQNLNIETEILVKETAELDAAKQANDFDLMRRGAVLPTSDEAMNMLSIFPFKKVMPGVADEKIGARDAEIIDKTVENLIAGGGVSKNPSKEISGAKTADDEDSNLHASEAEVGDEPILTERKALFEMHAIPLYFPTSYSLIKPYVQGFETNTLDAPSLKNVEIENDWQPEKVKGEL